MCTNNSNSKKSEPGGTGKVLQRKQHLSWVWKKLRQVNRQGGRAFQAKRIAFSRAWWVVPLPGNRPHYKNEKSPFVFPIPCNWSKKIFSCDKVASSERRKVSTMLATWLSGPPFTLWMFLEPLHQAWQYAGPGAVAMSSWELQTWAVGFRGQFASG